MKKQTRWFGIFAVCVALFLMGGVAFAGSSMTEGSLVRVSPKIFYQDFVFTAGTGGTFTDTTHQGTVNIAGYITVVETSPGAAAYSPTDNYDITILDSFGVDAMGGALADRSQTAKQRVFPLDQKDAGAFAPFVGRPQFYITNNTNPAATITIRVHWYRP